MILGRPSAAYSVDVSRAVGLFKQLGGPLTYAVLSLLAPFPLCASVAFRLQQQPQGLADHVGLWPFVPARVRLQRRSQIRTESKVDPV